MTGSPAILASERARTRLRRRPSRLIGAGLTALVVASGTVALNDSAVAAPAVAAPAQSTTNQSDARVNKSLDSLAKLFARAMTHENMRQSIHAAVAKRFDGDTDVLYTTLSTTSDVRKGLATAYSRGQAIQSADALSAVDRLASDIPRFQIAVPAKFDSWNAASYTPLVAYMPAGVEDTTLKTVTAYDAAGKAYALDAQVAPSRPVIVLGLNERTDNSGRLLHPEALSANRPTTATTSGQTSLTSTVYQVRMSKVHVINDNEPWTKGSAEISLRAQGCGLSYTDIDWSSLNDDGDWWIGPRYLGDTSCSVYFYWWEDDGTNWDFTLSYGGASLNVKMDDGDDLIGGIQLGLASFEGGTDAKASWSDLEQWTD